MKSLKNNIKEEIYFRTVYKRITNDIDMQLFGAALHKIFDTLYINLRVNLVNTPLDKTIF